ncbi:MAG: hypothetical protein QF805_26265, partial [Pirellulaceae bacterium]|nr:hypothetical protein [Pirellulaceae bacterium]
SQILFLTCHQRIVDMVGDVTGASVIRLGPAAIPHSDPPKRSRPSSRAKKKSSAQSGQRELFR